MGLLFDILDKLLIIVAFSALALCFEKTKILAYAGSKLQGLQSTKGIILCWFGLSFVVSGFFSDMVTAALLLPLAVVFCKDIDFKHTERLLLAVVFGISTGGDLTIFGGNDNLMAMGLLKNSGYTLDKLSWTNTMFVPTVLIGILACAVLMLGVKNVTLKPVVKTVQVCWLQFAVCMAVLIMAFIVPTYILVAMVAILCIACKITKTFLKRIPWRAMLIWTVAFIVGKLISAYAGALLPSYMSSMFILVAALIILTNVFTNTALMAAALPLIIAMNVDQSTCMAAIKAINIAYITIYGNSCLAVANGYGVRQAQLIKYGLPILIGSYIIIVSYFSIF